MCISGLKNIQIKFNVGTYNDVRRKMKLTEKENTIFFSESLSSQFVRKGGRNKVNKRASTKQLWSFNH